MSQSEHHLQIQGLSDGEVAEAVYPRVFRTSFDRPGFVILVLNPGEGSHGLRRRMVGLKEELSRMHRERWGEGLRYLSLGRFDQQNTTKLHLDGAPERSFLMLGYEPTKVQSTLTIADYTRCAYQLGMSPGEFLGRHNPMFGPGQEMLADYTLSISDWQEDHPRIVLINNSSVPLRADKATAGVLHGAVIASPDPTQQRVINSTMIAPDCFVQSEPALQVKDFMETDAISGPIVM